MRQGEPLTELEAWHVYTALMAECGAPEGWRDLFIFNQTAEHVSEWRFIGALGFGGKFWRTRGTRPDGTWGEKWYVSQYPENETPETLEMIQAANAKLWTLLQYHEEHPQPSLDNAQGREELPLHRTAAGWPRCSTCDGSGCLDCTDPA